MHSSDPRPSPEPCQALPLQLPALQGSGHVCTSTRVTLSCWSWCPGLLLGAGSGRVLGYHDGHETEPRSRLWMELLLLHFLNGLRFGKKEGTENKAAGGRLGQCPPGPKAHPPVEGESGTAAPGGCAVAGPGWTPVTGTAKERDRQATRELWPAGRGLLSGIRDTGWCVLLRAPGAAAARRGTQASLLDGGLTEFEF